MLATLRTVLFLWTLAATVLLSPRFSWSQEPLADPDLDGDDGISGTMEGLSLQQQYLIPQMTQSEPRSGLYATGRSSLFWIDTATGEARLVRTLDGGANSMGGIDAEDLLFLRTRSGLAQEHSRVDAKTGTEEALGFLSGTSPGAIVGIAQVDDTSAYVVMGGRDTRDSDWLVLVDLEQQTIGTSVRLDRSGVQSLAVSPDGTLYAWDIRSGLVRVDAVTGNTVDVKAGPSTLGIQALTFHPDGRLFAGRNVLYEVNPLTGDASKIGEFSVALDLDVRGLAFAAPDRAFVSVPPSGLPQAMSISFDNFCLEPGDEVGIFDGELCVGATTVIEPEACGVQFPIWKGDPLLGLEGFQPGNPMSVRVYSRAQGQDLLLAPQPERLFSDALDVFLLLRVLDASVTIELSANRSKLISFHGQPTVSELPDVFITQPFSFFGWFRLLSDDGGYYGGFPQSSTLTTWSSTEAYRVLSTEFEKFRMQGIRLPLTTTYPVRAGRWNWIGHPFAEPTPIDQALAAFADDIEIVQDDEGGTWIPSMSVNTLGNLETGRGYMVFPRQNLGIQYQAATSALRWTATKRKVADPLATGYPYAIVIDLPDRADAMGLDRVEVFDGDLMVGAADLDPNSRRQTVVAWQADPSSGRAGFTPGHVGRLAFQGTGAQRAAVEVQLGAGAFGRATVQEAGTSVVELPLVGEPYPNPFNPSVQINYLLPQSDVVRADVVDVTGRRVRQILSERQSAGRHVLRWDGLDDAGKGVSSGVYYLRIRGSHVNETRRAVLVR